MTKGEQLFAKCSFRPSMTLQAITERQQDPLSVSQIFDLEEQRLRARADQSPMVQWVKRAGEKKNSEPQVYRLSPMKQLSETS